VANKKVMATKALNVVRRSVNRCVARTINTWHEYKVKEARQRNRIKRLVQRMQNRRIVLALDLWHSGVLSALQGHAEEERRNGVMLKVVSRMLHAALTVSFLRWRKNVRELHRQRSVVERVGQRMMKVVQRLMNRMLVEGFERWRDQAAEEKQMKAKALKVVQWLMNSALVGCFERWRNQAAEEKQMKAKALKVVQRLMKSALVGCFERWRNQAAEEKQMKAKALKVVQRLMNSALAGCFERWRDSICEERQSKAKALADQERRKSVLQRVVKRIQHLTLASGLLWWREQVWKLQRQQGIFERVVGRMLHRCLLWAMGLWQENVQALQLVREGQDCKQALVEKILKRVMMKMISLAFDSIFFHFCLCAEHRAKIRKLKRRLNLIALCHRFELWSLYTIYERNMELKSLNVVLRLRSRRLVASLIMWRDHLLFQKQIKAKAHVIYRLLLWCYKGVQISYLHAWQTYTSTKMHQRYILAQMFNYYTMVEICEVFEAWNKITEILKRKTRRKQRIYCTIRRIQERMISSNMSDRLERWRDQAAEEKRIRRNAIKVVLRLMNSALVGCFERWRDQAAEEKQMKAKALKVVRRLMNRVLVECLGRWWDIVVEEKQMKAKALKVVQRMINRVFVEGFQRWRDIVVEERQMTDKALKVVRLLMNQAPLKLVRRLMNRELVECFERWRDKTAEEKGMKAKARRVLHGLMNTVLAAYFGKWCILVQDVVFERAEKDRRSRKAVPRMERILNRILLKAVSVAFGFWYERAAKVKRLKDVAGRIVRKLKRSTLMPYFDMWVMDTLMKLEHVTQNEVENTIILTRKVPIAQRRVAPQVSPFCDAHDKVDSRESAKALSKDAVPCTNRGYYPGTPATQENVHTPPAAWIHAAKSHKPFPSPNVSPVPGNWLLETIVSPTPSSSTIIHHGYVGLNITDKRPYRSLSLAYLLALVSLSLSLSLVCVCVCA